MEALEEREKVETEEDEEVEEEGELLDFSRFLNLQNERSSSENSKLRPKLKGRKII